MKGKIEIICTKCQSLLSGFLLSLKMNEASLLTLQKEIAELEQLLADKKHQLKEAQIILAKQTANSTTTQKHKQLFSAGNQNRPVSLTIQRQGRCLCETF